MSLYCAIPKRHKINFTDFLINCSHPVEWPAQLDPSSWILTHLQEKDKNTSLPSLFDPLTLALYSNSILSICLLFIKKNPTVDSLSIAYLFFSWKTNTNFLFSILSTCFLKKIKNLPRMANQGYPRLVFALACCCSFVGFDCFYCPHF